MGKFLSKVTWDAICQVNIKEGVFTVTGQVEGQLPTKLYVRVSDKTENGANISTNGQSSELPSSLLRLKSK